MKDKGVSCSFHYVPLHSAPVGLKFGCSHGEDMFTTREGDRLVRLPMYYGLSEADSDHIVSAARPFFTR